MSTAQWVWVCILTQLDGCGLITSHIISCYMTTPCKDIIFKCILYYRYIKGKRKTLIWPERVMTISHFTTHKFLHLHSHNHTKRLATGSIRTIISHHDNMPKLFSQSVIFLNEQYCLIFLKTCTELHINNVITHSYKRYGVILPFNLEPFLK